MRPLAKPPQREEKGAQGRGTRDRGEQRRRGGKRERGEGERRGQEGTQSGAGKSRERAATKGARKKKLWRHTHKRRRQQREDDNMTPRIGASGADWSTALAPELDRPGVNPLPRTGASEATGPPGLEHLGRSCKRTKAYGTRTGTSGDAAHPDWNIRGAEAVDWNVRGRIGLGFERPGQQKEKETATERKGEENMNKSKEQMRNNTKNRRREAGGEREQGEAAKHMEPGWEQPGKQRTRTGSSGVGRPCMGAPGLQEEEAVAAARNGSA